MLAKVKSIFFKRFCWVFCQLDKLKKYKDKRALDNTLESFPKIFHKTYNRILQNINAQYQETVGHALIWLVFSKRSLKIEEVADANILDLEDKTFDFDKQLFDPNSILEILGNLVTYSSKNGASKVIRFTHFSVQEYFVSQEIKSSKASKFGIINMIPDLFIAKSCLHYHCYYDKSGLKTISTKDLETFPLLRYACQYWYIHAEKIPSEIQKLTDSILRLFFSDTALMSWLRVYAPDGGKNFLFKDLVDIATSLYYASADGSEIVIPLLLENGANVNVKTGDGKTAL